MPQPRKPNEIHVAQGTYRADRHGSAVTAKDTEFITELPPAPEHLKESGRGKWEEIGAALVRATKLTERDLFQLELASKLWQDIRDIDDGLAALHPKDAEGEAVPPRLDEQITQKLFALRLRHQTVYHQVLKELGCGNVARSQAAMGSPSSRSGGIPSRQRA